MSSEVWAILVIGLANLAGIGYLWSISKQGGDLRERLARAEEQIEAAKEVRTSLQTQLTALVGLLERERRDER